MRHKFSGHIGRVENAFPRQVGDGHFRGRNQIISRVAGSLEQVLLELRQLTRPDQCICLHQVRDVCLFVAMLTTMHVEHELDQRTLQPGELAAHDGEAGSRDTACRVEVQKTETGTKIDMISCLEFKLGHVAPRQDLCIGQFIRTGGDVIVQQVRQAKLDVLQFRLDRLQLGRGFVEPVAEFLYRSQ